MDWIVTTDTKSIETPCYTVLHLAAGEIGLIDQITRAELAASKLAI